MVLTEKRGHKKHAPVFQQHMLVLAQFKRKEFVQKINCREVPKDNAAR